MPSGIPRDSSPFGTEWAYQLLMYVDNVNMFVDSTNTIKENTETLLEASRCIGLEINAEESNYMIYVFSSELRTESEYKDSY
jgi:hypothetical protein